MCYPPTWCWFDTIMISYRYYHNLSYIRCLIHLRFSHVSPGGFHWPFCRIGCASPRLHFIFVPTKPDESSVRDLVPSCTHPPAQENLPTNTCTHTCHTTSPATCHAPPMLHPCVLRLSRSSWTHGMAKARHRDWSQGAAACWDLEVHRSRPRPRPRAPRAPPGA